MEKGNMSFSCRKFQH